MPGATDTGRRQGGTPHPASPEAEAERQRLLDEHRERHDEADDEPRTGKDLMDAAARSADGKSRSTLSADEQVNALDWFLSDTDAVELEHTFEMNVGSPTHKRWISWTVKSVDMDELKRIRKQSQTGNRRERRSGQTDFDEVQANIQIVLKGTVSPDLRAAAKQLGMVDPGDAVRTRFGHKPGLLAQIAGEIMSISGYDDEDVREVDAARG